MLDLQNSLVPFVQLKLLNQLIVEKLIIKLVSCNASGTYKLWSLKKVITRLKKIKCKWQRLFKSLPAFRFIKRSLLSQNLRFLKPKLASFSHLLKSVFDFCICIPIQLPKFLCCTGTGILNVVPCNFTDPHNFLVWIRIRILLVTWTLAPK